MDDEDHTHHIEVKDHLERDAVDECAYCGQSFGPDEIAIERTLYGRKWRFCSDQCYQDFRDASDFKDQDLDSDNKELHVNVEDEKEEDLSEEES
jgi:hypothetical protein